VDIKIGVSQPVYNPRFLLGRGISTVLQSAAAANSSSIIVSTNVLRSIFPRQEDFADNFYKIHIGDNSVHDICFISYVETTGNYNTIHLNQVLTRVYEVGENVTIENTGLADGWHVTTGLDAAGLERLRYTDMPYSIDRFHQKIYYRGSTTPTFKQSLRGSPDINNKYLRYGAIWQIRKENVQSALVQLRLSYMDDVDSWSSDTTNVFNSSLNYTSTEWEETSGTFLITSDSSFYNTSYVLSFLFSASAPHYFYIDGAYLEHAVGTSGEDDGVFSLDQFPDIGVDVSKKYSEVSKSMLRDGNTIKHKRLEEPKYEVTLQFTNAKTSDFKQLFVWQRHGNFLNLHMGSDWFDLVPPVLTGKIIPPTLSHNFWKNDRASFTLKFIEV